MKSLTRAVRGVWTLLFIPLSTVALFGQNASYRPGVTDPAGNPANFSLFRDQQVFVMSPGTKATPWQTATFGFQSNYLPLNGDGAANVSQLPWSAAIPWEQVNIQAVAGRIVHPDKDDIAIVQRSETDSSQLIARFSDGSGATTFGPIPPRTAGFADFFSTSEGDLDRLYDSQGNYHDEVVTAWIELESLSGACSAGTEGATVAVPHIAVLNYNGGGATPSILTQRVDRDDQQYLPACALEGYNYYLGGSSLPAVAPQPSDNIIATAIGDFDGDGYNELAVAYMRGTNGVVISIVIYRYQNDGTTASLTPVNTFEIYRSDRSMVGTLSLAAGDFNGSGADQLLIGSAYWWGTPNGVGYASGTLQTQPVFFLLNGGQVLGSVTSAASSGVDNSQTDFAVSLGKGVYVPRTVTISGANGSWTPINGTWPVTLTADGFSIDIDSSDFGSFDGQTIQFTAAAALTQADSMVVDTVPEVQTGAMHIDDSDLDRIRVQMVPGLFHFDPSNGFDYRRRQVAVAWNARPSGNSWGGHGDSHLDIIQVANNKITVAAQQNLLLANFQTFQNLALAAGAFRGDNSTNDPTWSLFLSGVGQEVSGSVAEGTVHAIWKVAPVSTDPTKLQLSQVCTGKASDDPNSPTYYGFVQPICQIWGADARMESPTGPYIFAPNYYLRLPAIAADLNGNSIRLGAPMHFEITNPGKADFILEQPPQHSAWLDLGQGAEVVTINRYPSFNTSMLDSTQKSFASKNQDHTDWTVGGSVDVSASARFSAGEGVPDVEEVDEQTNVSVSAKVSYDYDNVSSNYNSNYDAYTVGQNAVTGQDDSLILESQVLDLWRYRMYGNGTNTNDPNNPNAFYDIVIPGPSLKSNPGGRDVDWYQPLHEVGNILSYPQRASACNPSDLGTITIPNTDISNQAIPLISCSQQFYNGNASALSLTLDHQTGSGTSTDFTNKVHADLDFQYSYQVDFYLFGNGGHLKTGVDVDAHGGKDWGHLNTSDNATTNATGITVNSPQGDSNHAYPYYPILYDTISGALKVAYGVGDLSASGAGGEFWVDNYGLLPDPALNLPNRFTATYGPSGNLNGWQPETTIVRKRMKGFVVRKPAIDTLLGIYPLLGSNPQDGDTVMLDARVYNYSISAKATGPITVQFSVIPYDSSTDNEICANIPATGGGRVCPASARTPIGVGSSAPVGGKPTISLTARQSADAYLIWNTKGFGPQGAGVKEYRVYVDLVANPNGPGEIYPPEPPCTAVPCEDNAANEKIVDPGQNNEGWSLITVAAPSLGGPSYGPSPYATQGSLGTGSASASSSSAQTATAADPAACNQHTCGTPAGLQAFLYQPLPLRASAFSNASSPIYGYVQIFDGTPGSANAKLIAVKTLHGLAPTGTSAWFSWIPTQKGPHHLYAVVHNNYGVTPLGDVVVQVSRAPGDVTEDGRVDRHDLDVLQRDLGKSVAESACGTECDFDGDGTITQKDADLMAALCDSKDCGFQKVEYVGGPSALEPDMRTIHATDQAVLAAYLAANPEDEKALSSASAQATAKQLYQTELTRKQGLRSILYYYKGKPVTAGSFAATAAITTGTGGSSKN